MRRVVPVACEASGCSERARSRNTPRCERHDANWKRYGTLDAPAVAKQCDECGDTFWSARRYARFCSKPCYRGWWRKAKAADAASRCKVAIGPCVVCGTIFVSRKIRGRGAERCSEECKAESKRRYNRERERALFAETGECRGRAVERANPQIIARRRAVQAAEDAQVPRRKMHPESTDARDARRRLRKRQDTPSPVEPFTRREIGERDGWVCQLCFEPIDPSLEYPDPRSQSLYHKVPIAEGGAHRRENTQIAHLVCNVTKRDRLQDPAG